MSENNYPSPDGARVVAFNLASSTAEFLLKVQKYGFSIDKGAADLNPWTKVGIEALFHVLAGGEVEVKIKRPGNPDIVDGLNTLLQKSIDESNTINGGLPFYLTIMG